MCKETYITISAVPQLVFDLQEDLKVLQETREAETLRKALLASTKQRLNYILEEPNIALKAACMDPQHAPNLKKFVKKEVLDSVWQQLSDDYDNFARKIATEEDSQYPDANEIVKDQIICLRNFFESDKAPKKVSNSLIWWKNWKAGEKLADFAKKLLCIPATSCSSERCFSSAGNIYTEARARLDPDTVEKVVFVRENLKILPEDLKELLKVYFKEHDINYQLND